MIELDRFSNQKEDVVFEFLLESFSYYHCGDGSIYVEGIEFRAIEKVKLEDIEKLEEVSQVLKLYFEKLEVPQVLKSYCVDQLPRIASVAIIDRQLPFEYTIASRSTDVMVPVLRVEKKMYVIEQLIPPALAANSKAQVLAEWNAVYDAHNEIACLMLESMTPELHRQFENYLSQPLKRVPSN
nr:protein kinase-like domain, phloem protein 2-like protein [Tanacetum cinerariifolium]